MKNPILKTPIFAIATLFLFSATHVQAQSGSWTIDPNHSQAGFEVRHLGISNVRGTISKISGTVVWDANDPAKDSVVADLDTTTVDTTVANRDKDLRSPNFFNVEKYPTMHFQSTSVKRVDGKLKVFGDLTLTGVTKPVTLDVEGPVVPPQKDPHRGLVTGISATTVLKRADFNFGPKYAPPMIGDQVKVTIDIEFAQK